MTSCGGCGEGEALRFPVWEHFVRGLTAGSGWSRRGRLQPRRKTSVSGGSDELLAQVALIVRKCLEEGFPVEIEGLGTFLPHANGGVEFVAETRPKVFIAYVEEDYQAAERLYNDLTAEGFDPWLDKKKLLPGQNWPRSIERTIEVSDFFIACFSRRAVGKRGYFHSELRYALDCAGRLPLGETYFIPVRLDNCQVPSQIARQIQYVDLFPSWEEGFQRVLSVMRGAGKRQLRGKSAAGATAGVAEPALRST